MLQITCTSFCPMGRMCRIKSAGLSQGLGRRAFQPGPENLLDQVAQTRGPEGSFELTVFEAGQAGHDGTAQEDTLLTTDLSGLWGQQHMGNPCSAQGHVPSGPRGSLPGRNFPLLSPRDPRPQPLCLQQDFPQSEQHADGATPGTACLDAQSSRGTQVGCDPKLEPQKDLVI